MNCRHSTDGGPTHAAAADGSECVTWCGGWRARSPEGVAQKSREQAQTTAEAGGRQTHTLGVAFSQMPRRPASLESGAACQHTSETIAFTFIEYGMARAQAAICGPVCRSALALSREQAAFAVTARPATTDGFHPAKCAGRPVTYVGSCQRSSSIKRGCRLLSSSPEARRGSPRKYFWSIASRASRRACVDAAWRVIASSERLKLASTDSSLDSRRRAPVSESSRRR
mmetsp:Transcript_76406/g.247876  ORF Transcript_76406/g.247876 Transcript_76406/m.247876 type:complete len:227 (+) Transcript_76406:343-1023(+)